MLKLSHWVFETLLKSSNLSLDVGFLNMRLNEIVGDVSFFINHKASMLQNSTVSRLISQGLFKYLYTGWFKNIGTKLILINMEMRSRTNTFLFYFNPTIIKLLLHVIQLLIMASLSHSAHVKRKVYVCPDFL